MVNKPKQKGTKFESDCVKAFKAAGFKARRLALSGNNDQGDIELEVFPKRFYAIECKNFKTYSRKHIEEWRRQAIAERLNYMEATGNDVLSPVLIVSQYGKSLSESFVHFLSGANWMQVFFDEWLDIMDANVDRYSSCYPETYKEWKNA